MCFQWERDSLRQWDGRTVEEEEKEEGRVRWSEITNFDPLLSINSDPLR